MQDMTSNIYSVAAVREIDRIAIEEHGVPGYTLMKRAAEAAFDDARAQFPDTDRWQIICGAGNNAGDGYAVARLAATNGIAASVISLVDTEKLKGDAARAHADFLQAGGAVDDWVGELDDDAELLIDAILGSGLERDVSGEFANAVDALNDHWAPVHAMDIATGINGNSGEIMGNAVIAELTTTFVGLKSGLFLGEGPEYCGEIYFADLDIPSEWHNAVSPDYRRVDDLLLLTWLHRRERAAHKGDFGHVLVVGGGPGMPGAALLCGSAALRTGAGRVSVATHPSHAGALAAARPELMVHGVDRGADLAALLERADVVAFGPGLGDSDWAVEMHSVLVNDSRRCVWDADALNILASAPQAVQHRIITPHPGEAGRLNGCGTEDVQADRLAALDALQDRYGGVAVLKGAGTLVSAGGRPWLCTAGNPGMAAPGMGDVLTGVIAGLLGQGLPLEEAAAIGVEVHARAGDIAAEQGERGLLASDVIDVLPWVVNP
ncbi:MAG: NAD(P)H-hydrate dehydratase [Pseudomonadota bacterium]